MHDRISKVVRDIKAPRNVTLEKKNVSASPAVGGRQPSLHRANCTPSVRNRITTVLTVFATNFTR